MTSIGGRLPPGKPESSHFAPRSGRPRVDVDRSRPSGEWVGAPAVGDRKPSAAGLFPRRSLPDGWTDDLRCLSIFRPWPLIIEALGKRVENRQRTRFLQPVVGRYVALYGTLTTAQGIGPRALADHVPDELRRASSHDGQVRLGSVGITAICKVRALIRSEADIDATWTDPRQAALQRSFWIGPEAAVLTDVWRLMVPVRPCRYGLTGMQVCGLWRPPEEMRQAIMEAAKMPAPTVAEVLARSAP